MAKEAAPRAQGPAGRERLNTSSNPAKRGREEQVMPSCLAANHAASHAVGHALLQAAFPAYAGRNLGGHSASPSSIALRKGEPDPRTREHLSGPAPQPPPFPRVSSQQSKARMRSPTARVTMATDSSTSVARPPRDPTSSGNRVSAAPRHHGNTWRFGPIG